MRAALLTLLVAAHAGVSDPKCELSAEALNRYDQRLLSAAEGLPSSDAQKKIEDPLRCIFEIQKHGEGHARPMAQSYLRPLLGGKQTAGIPVDPRYRKVVEFLNSHTLAVQDLLDRSVVSEYAKGDWTFYVLFCEQGDTSFCPDFLPDANQVKTEEPLLAAASMLRLRKAYHALKGKERQRVAETLKALYRQIPQQHKLQRRFIDQIYDELFPRALPLGMA